MPKIQGEIQEVRNWGTAIYYVVVDTHLHPSVEDGVFDFIKDDLTITAIDQTLPRKNE